MSTRKRNVSLYCPVCGNDQFSCVDMELDDLSDAPDGTRIQCADCNSIFTKAKLIAANHDVIAANIDEMTEQVVKDLQKKFNGVIKW